MDKLGYGELNVMSKVFLSYSRKDRQWVDILGEFLRKHNISFWSDTEINPGENWRDAIKNSLDKSQVSIVLISPEYLASEFVKNFELPLILKKAEKNEIKLLLVNVSPFSKLDDSLDKYQFVNLITEPLSTLQKTKQEGVFMELLKEINNYPLHQKIQDKDKKEQTIESADKYSTALKAAIKNIGGNVGSLNVLGGTNIFFEAEAALAKKDGK
jgi:hypothetical protein